MAEKQKKSLTEKEAPKWLGIVAGVLGAAAFGAAIWHFVSPSNKPNKPSDSSESAQTQTNKHDTIPDACVTNAEIKSKNKVKSSGSVVSYTDAIHEKVSTNKMIHRWNGEHFDGSTATFSCFTTIKSDGSETIDELWLDTERLL